MVPLRPPHQEQPSSAPLDVAEVYRVHGEQIERWAARLGGPLVDAEEVVQEVLLVVQRRLPELRAEAALGTWLFRITQNLARKRRQRERLRRWLRGLPGEYARDVPSEDLLPVDQLERKEAAAAAYEALDGLDERHRTVVILYELEGLSGEEIAALLTIKLATVWVRLHRGREKLRSRFSKIHGKGRAS